jgi:ribulose-phosphate 3-epimerase
MGIIVPAIIPASRPDLEDKLARLAGLCEEVQIDIVDGVYAKPSSWPYLEDPAEPSRMLADGELLPRAGEFRFEIDLMSGDPESSAGAWIGLGANRLTIHAESTRYLSRFIGNTRSWYGHDKDFPGLVSLGLAIGAETDIALVEPFLDRIDYVQFMGIRTIGHQGEPFDPGVLPRILAFKNRHPKVEVTVDGGVTRENAAQLLSAGVSRLVVGSAIWKAPDPVAAYRELDALTRIHGIYE